jgi:hypothetical protein
LLASKVTVTVAVETVTLNDPDAVLPALSCAEQVTVVAPSGNVDPEGGVQVTGTEPSTRSEAEAEKFTTTPLAPAAACTVISAGRLNFGGVLSTTVTLNDADPVLPALSVAEHVTLVEPSGNVDPEEGVQVGVRDAPAASSADAVKVTIAPLGPLASTVMSLGTVTTGGVGVGSLGRKLAVTVPAPRMMAFVEADVELVKVIEAESLLHDEKV